MKKLILTSSILGLLLACGPVDTDTSSVEVGGPTAETLSRHIEILSSDAFEGRAPSTEGEVKTINYLRDEFEKLGVSPGNGTSYFQEVPLVTVTSTPAEPLTVTYADSQEALEYQTDYMAWTSVQAAEVTLENSELVFAGYGIVAPEFGWNDYEGLDVTGKTVLILVNDPGFATQDEALFNGNSMTYYGRWTYKFEEAARQGAAGALVIHETGPAGYGWEVVSGISNSVNISIQREADVPRLQMQGWISSETTDRLMKQAGGTLEGYKEQALTPEFAAVSLNEFVTVSFETSVEQSHSNNVLAVIPGSSRPDEYVFYMAHWDHLGTDPSLEGDQIYNGALDNASGTAALLALAEAFQNSANKTERSIAFLAVTAEERGLLGSEYYASHPVYPLSKTVAAINMDVLNFNGRMNDVTVVGFGNSELDAYVEIAAAAQQRIVRPDPQPEKGYFYRSDHFSFAKQGIPAVYTNAGIDHEEFGEEYSQMKMDEYRRERYHQVADEFDKNTWDMSGAIQDLTLLYALGRSLADTTEFPNWTEGNEFRAKRDAQMNLFE